MTVETFYYHCGYGQPGLEPDPTEACLSWKTTRDIHAVNGGFDEWECQWLVEEIAEDYYDNHDGWEWTSWTSGSESVVFFIFDKDLKFLFSTMVDIETRPVFSAGKILGVDV